MLRDNKYRKWLVFFVPIGLAVAIVGFHIAVVQPAAATASCDARLGSIGSYFHMYHTIHGHFPPAIEYDQAGKPQHSWRILLLKTCEPDVCREYDLNLPWDDPVNQRLMAQTPALFRCPIGHGYGDTSYALIVGTGSVYASADARPTLANVVGPHHQTAFLIEIQHSGINWLEPRDVTPAEVVDLVNNSAMTGYLSRSHRAEIGFLLLTQAVIRVRPKEFTDDQLKALLAAGGDKASLDAVRPLRIP